MTIEFDFQYPPKPAPRPRFTKNGIVYEPKAYKDYKGLLTAKAIEVMAERQPISTCVWAQINFFRRTDPISRNYGDIDNLTKAVLDALNGIVYTDDCIIVGLGVTKNYDANSRVHIKVSDFPFELTI